MVMVKDFQLIRQRNAHFVRGLLGAVLIALALWVAPRSPWLGLLALGGALLAFKGCPMCWFARACALSVGRAPDADKRGT